MPSLYMDFWRSGETQKDVPRNKIGVQLKSLPLLLYCLVILPCYVGMLSQSQIIFEGQRIKVSSSFRFSGSLIEPAGVPHHIPILSVGNCQIWIERKGSLELRRRTSPSRMIF